MTLLRLVQRVSLLAGITAIGLSIPHSPAKAEISEVCIIASNGKTVCGKMRLIERMCVTTDGRNNICGKFKSAKEEQERGQEQTAVRTPAPSSGYRKELNGVTYLLRNCRRSNSDIKCNFLMTTKKEHRVLINPGKGYSSIVDSSGKTYPSSNVEYNGETNNQFVRILSPGIDYVMDMNFENIPEQITKASLITLSGNEVVQFRNVPFSN